MLSSIVQISWEDLVFSRVSEDNPDPFTPAEAYSKATHLEQLWPGPGHLKDMGLPCPFSWLSPGSSIYSRLNMVFRNPAWKYICGSSRCNGVECNEDL